MIHLKSNLYESIARWLDAMCSERWLDMQLVLRVMIDDEGSKILEIERIDIFLTSRA